MCAGLSAIVSTPKHSIATSRCRETEWLICGAHLRVGRAIRCSRCSTASNRDRTHEAPWLILPVVICLSQRLSHACLSACRIKDPLEGKSGASSRGNSSSNSVY
ncbi:hypothetical protein PUN28_017872 [Cardiocondyla obscurior]|uniref:Uncharacterized protein n=1 Tax=Cardiocondyla obscurior TaxID=286306 RepID=A0AAW2ELN1_9HYME